MSEIWVKYGWGYSYPYFTDTSPSILNTVKFRFKAPSNNESLCLKKAMKSPNFFFSNFLFKNSNNREPRYKENLSIKSLLVGP